MMFSLSERRVKLVILDIEGTTTPISFVYDELFPFAHSHAAEYLNNHFFDPEVQQDLELLRKEQANDLHQAQSPPQVVTGSRAQAVESFTAYIHWLMDQDRKSTGLKSLQGKVWEQGYRDGLLRAAVFKDVRPALKRWREAALKIAIFSSGSVLAQKLLFAHTSEGDLTEFIDRYFDTTTGPKASAESYRNITSAMGFASVESLFISDVTSELDAALSAGLRTLLCLRPGNRPQPPSEHPTIHTFDEIG